MKILQLNVWMGKVEGNLRRFLEKSDYDVICMQEVMASKDAELHLSRLCFDLSQILKATKAPYYFFSGNYSSKIGDGHFELGNLIISKMPIRKTYETFTSGAYEQNLIYEKLPKNNLNIQAVELEDGLVVVNHHGFWRPQPMGDADSEKAFANVERFVKQFENQPLVMCGDLNLEHDAPAMRSLDFLHDLTYENSIKNTLSGLKYNGEVACDHILTNDKIEAEDFKVLDDVVSDHLPLECKIYLEEEL